VSCSPTRRSGVGVTSSASSMPTDSGDGELEPVINGIWTRSSSRINGVTHYLWRAVDQNGVVLDILVQPKRHRFAAIRFFRKLLRETGRKPRVIITDKLRSYGAAKRVVMPSVAHRQHRYLNNRAENSHQPPRERERRMRRFKSARHAQRFVEVHGIVASHFRPRRHLLPAADYRDLRSKRFRVWNQVTRASALA
jgi:putative transposase